MKKIIIFALTSILAFFAAACSTSGGGGNNNNGNSKVAGKWITEPNDDDIAYLEFLTDGRYILAQEFEIDYDEVSYISYWGAYKVKGDEVTLYSLESTNVLGTVTITSLKDNSLVFELDSELVSGSGEFTAEKAEEMPSTTKTDLLCRTWELVSSDGNDPYDFLEAGERVIFSKAGSYLDTFTDGRGLLSSWQWKSEEEGYIYSAWLHPPTWSDEETLTVEEVSDTELVLYRRYGGTATGASTYADDDTYWTRSSYKPAAAPETPGDGGNGGDGGDGGGGSGKTLTFVFENYFTNLHIAGTGNITIDWGDGSELYNFTLSPQEVDDRWSSIDHEVYWSYSDGKERHTVTITGGNITHFGQNNIVSLDVSEINTLNWMFVGVHHDMTELDLTGNPELRYLDIGGASREDLRGNLGTFDLSRNPKLAYFKCIYAGLSYIDLSNNPLIEGDLILSYNRLTSLDVSAQTATYTVNVIDNELSADALNELFGTLHSNNIPGHSSKTILINQNPGRDYCNQDIARDKGWNVRLIGN